MTRSLDEQMRAVQRGLRHRARKARAAARLQDNIYAAAALRGKALAYLESADAIESMLRTGHLRRKWAAPAGERP
jgi:hypothetical protein